MPRILVAVMLLLCLHGAWSMDGLGVSIGADDVAADYRDGVYFGRLSFRVAVPPALALEVMTDFDHMAEFVPNVVSSSIAARNGNVYRIVQKGRADFGPFTYPFESERQVELMPDNRLISRAISGSTKSMRSELRVQSIPAGTVVDYQIEMVPGQWVPSSIGLSFMRHELAEQFTALMREMERRNLKRSQH